MRIFLVSLFLSVAAYGQQAPVYRGVAAGVVVTGEGRAAQPLRRANVTLDTVPPRTQLTDDGGRFKFDNLPEGRYVVFAAKTGYVTVEYGATRFGQAGTPVVIAAGRTPPDLRIQMPPGAVITGTIAGADGRPAPNAAVVALASHGLREDGTRNLAPVAQFHGAGPGSTGVDAKGEFRIFDLPPGSYALRASTTGPDGSRVTVYYPGTSNPADAGLINVEAGQEQRVQLTAGAEPAGARATVEGRLTLGGGALRDARLHVLDDDAFDSVTTVTNDRFRITGVTAGTHLIEARAVHDAPGAPGSVVWGQATVVVSARDVTGVGIAMQPAMSVSGRVQYEGASAPVSTARVTVSLRPVVPWGSSESISGSVGAGGDFEIANVPPGRYRVDASVGGSSADAASSRWALKSFLIGGRDVVDTAPLTIAPGESVKGAAVTLTSLRQHLSGTVVAADGSPALDLTVVVIPKDRTLWADAARRIQGARPDTTGWYVLDDLPAGDYLLVALRDVDRDDLADPVFITLIAASAMPVSLAPGERKRLDLRPKMPVALR